MAFVRDFLDEALDVYEKRNDPSLAVHHKANQLNLTPTSSDSAFISDYLRNLSPGGNAFQSQSSSLDNFLDKYLSMETKATEQANALQRQLMNDQIAATRQENALDRQFSAEQVRNQQEYNTSERLAAQEFNSAEAQRTRDWQTEMDNSKYQRMVADLKAAGLNPMLALGNSAGSTPSGATAHSSAASSSAASAPGRSFTSASAFKREYSNVLGKVMDYLLRSQSLHQEASQFSQRLEYDYSKLTIDSISNLVNAITPW